MKTKEEYIAYNTFYRSTYPVKCMWYNIRSRAKARGIEFDISFEQFEELANDSLLCPVFGYELEYLSYTGTGSKISNPRRASLDRKDSSKGYTLDNVWFISWEANRMKNEYTTSQLEQLVKALKEAGIE